MNAVGARDPRRFEHLEIHAYMRILPCDMYMYICI